MEGFEIYVCPQIWADDTNEVHNMHATSYFAVVHPQYKKIVLSDVKAEVWYKVGEMSLEAAHELVGGSIPYTDLMTMLRFGQAEEQLKPKYIHEYRERGEQAFEYSWEAKEWLHKKDEIDLRVNHSSGLYPQG